MPPDRGGRADDGEERRSGASAAAAMDALDAEESDPAPGGPDNAPDRSGYRALPALGPDELAEHIRVGTRVVDGTTHQLWDWTNADVARVARRVTAARFPDAPARRELSESEGFDEQGRRVVAGERGDAVRAGAEVRFNDIVRELDGTRVYGTGHGLLLAEIQQLRTRFLQLVADEESAARDREDRRRLGRQLVVIAVVLAVFVAVMVAVFLG